VSESDDPPPGAQDDADDSHEADRLMRERAVKVDALRARGVNPYPSGFEPAESAAEARAAIEAAVAPGTEGSTDRRFRIAGRIVAMRSFGRAAFVKLRDRSGEVQVHVKRDVLGDETFGSFALCDAGDFLGVEGPGFRTRTGEPTVLARSLRFLGKAVRPLPEKWHGLRDHEARYRQRYLDLIANPDVARAFRLRSRIVRAIRAFFDARDYLEVETPLLHPLRGGALARPFVTRHNALDLQLFLRIAPELYLKRLVVGGFERVYEIGRNFRNEGLSRRHNPEFTMLEFYQAYATCHDLMDLTETLIVGLIREIHGGATLVHQGRTIDLAPPWTRMTYDQIGGEEAAEKMSESRPVFVHRWPVASSPLARRADDDPRYVDRFELCIGGMEVANAFSELNDPADQRARFAEQIEHGRAGDAEAMEYDEDYCRALEHGLPPTAGEGIGIDRLVMLLADQPSIRDVILFPLLRPE
jgi:lysyl-tRNA synthetase class 2